MSEAPLHVETPMVESEGLSRQLGTRVWLKMEALQPTGSFKLRGIGHACATYARRGARRFVCSSGGNAGIAVAYCGQQLDIPVTVIVPESTSARSIERMRKEGAHVTVHGRSWQESHEYAVRMAEADLAYIHPFDDPLLWDGHATMIDEIARQGTLPDVVVLSVGGGGLLCGAVRGLRRNGMGDVSVVAVETIGAHSLAASLERGIHITLDRISSVATTLGARRVAEAAYSCASAGNVHSVLVTDTAAVQACLDFQAEHDLVVEPACGASLAVVRGDNEVLARAKEVVVIVCGGVGVSMDQLQTWQRELPNQDLNAAERRAER